MWSLKGSEEAPCLGDSGWKDQGEMRRQQLGADCKLREAHSNAIRSNSGKGGGAREAKVSDCINRQQASRSPHTDPNLRLSISPTALVSSSTQPQPWLRYWL